jgi:transcriptional regulator with XRE-family HTH domain
VQRPPFPDTPGKWLACYRYRWQPGGRACSPEQLGAVLGVSGTTVRRWEAGQLRPTREDISSVAKTCELTALEEQFLLNAFQARDVELPSTVEAYEIMARTALQSDYPAFVIDSLFYLRARNRYMRGLVMHTLPGLPNNVLHTFYGLARGQIALGSPLGMVRSFWFATASLNGLPPYRRLLASLRGIKEFEDHWWRIALTRDEAHGANNLPTSFQHPTNGLYRVHMTRIMVPPVYYLREYLPVDERAFEFMRELRESGPDEVEIGTPHHWAIQE